jgi:hypothetical protein
LSCTRTRLLNRVVPATGKHFRSHSRTRQFNSARTSGSCNSTALFTCCDAIKAGLPPPPVLHCASNPRYVAPASTSARMKGARRAWLLRARYARPLPSLRGFSFQFALPYSYLRLREDGGLPVLGPCLPLRFPRRPQMSITRDPPAHQLGHSLSSPSGNTAMRCTPPPCMSLPCSSMLCIAPPVAKLALASALPHRMCTCPSRAHP